MHIWRRWRHGVVAVTAAMLMLTGCTQSSAGSRATLYDNVDELAADSAAIVIGTVSDQHRDGDSTVSSLEVVNAPANPHLATNLVDAGNTVNVGDSIAVRQDADPILATGDEYLLFITPSTLPGDGVEQYFITGAVAGLYVRDGAEYRRVVTDSGDELPETFAIAE